MCKSCVASGGLAVVLVLAGAGCGKSKPTDGSGPAAGSVPANSIARLHWVGKGRLATDTNAAGLMRIWQAPESARLEAQTLEKLSRAPWRFLFGDEHATNAANALLQPLLQ